MPFTLSYRGENPGLARAYTGWTEEEEGSGKTHMINPDHRYDPAVPEAVDGEHPNEREIKEFVEEVLDEQHTKSYTVMPVRWSGPNQGHLDFDELGFSLLAYNLNSRGENPDVHFISDAEIDSFEHARQVEDQVVEEFDIFEDLQRSPTGDMYSEPVPIEEEVDYWNPEADPSDKLFTGPKSSYQEAVGMIRDQSTNEKGCGSAALVVDPETGRDAEKQAMVASQEYDTVFYLSNNQNSWKVESSVDARREYNSRRKERERMQGEIRNLEDELEDVRDELENERSGFL